MSYYGDRNYQLQGCYTRYYDGLHVGYDCDSSYTPSKRRNFSTMEKALRAAKKELKRNELPKVVRVKKYRKQSSNGITVDCSRYYAEDGHEFTYDEEFEFWHTDGLRIVDRETQEVLWEA